MLERSFALGADENLEEVGREAHEAAYPSRLRAGSLRRHLGRTFTCRSRNTRWPRSVSILARAAAPRALMVRPPSPMTIPFWLSRSTYSTARIYTGSAPPGTRRSRTRRCRAALHAVARTPPRE